MVQPKLRFPEFTDEWEKQQFGDFVTEHSEKTSDIKKYPLYSLTIEEGVIPKSDRYERDFLITKEGDAYKIVPSKAFVYNPMNLRFGALKVNHEDFSVSVSGYYNVFSLKDNSTIEFWENYLTTSRMLNHYFSIATGSLIEKLRVYYSQFVEIEKRIPSLQEQQKISGLFCEIDKKIKNRENIVFDYIDMKKSFVDKIFNQEIRFKDNDGNYFPKWGKCKLQDVSFYVTETGTGTKISFVGTENMQKGCAGINFEDDSEELVKGVVYNLNDILVSNIRPYLKKAWKSDRTGICSTDVLCIRGNDTINSDFLYALIASDNFFNYVMQGAKGTKMPRGDKKHIMNMPVFLPCLDEQKKIADFLFVLDKKIEAEKKILEDWKQLKQALLQQMFV